ncbi:MAG TPA: hypothetical protein VL547_07310 [Dinghuibacter sp.]|uniref:hypothetical protein n=1 Tax=Dinghuibacter sp. TaxID=2024697 RepID=UPI002BCC4E1F|nr:hypothetical protein [Dinghuibacter sp.]HTJ11814.1 hypothetical protein [Dinghuibacter sp.]
MKTSKSLLLSAGLVLAAAAHAQQTVHFKLSYDPNTVYNIELTQKTNIHFNLDSSSDEVKAQMDTAKFAAMGAKGMANHLQSTLTTGPQDPATSRSPIRMEVQHMGSDDSAQTLPFRMVLGHVEPNSWPVFDSIVTDNPEPAFSKLMVTTMNNMFSEMRIPEFDITPGHSYTYSSPLSFPVGPMAIKMKLQTTFTLVNISGGVAHFNTTTVIAMDMDGGDNAMIPMTATGSGSGTSDYDIQGRFMRASNLKYTMDMGIHKEPLIMHILFTINQQMSTSKQPAKKG